MMIKKGSFLSTFAVQLAKNVFSYIYRLIRQWISVYLFPQGGK